MNANRRRTPEDAARTANEIARRRPDDPRGSLDRPLMPPGGRDELDWLATAYRANPGSHGRDHS